MQTILDRISKYKMVPVIALESVADAAPLARALCEGGLPVAEITFRTPCAADAIAKGKELFPSMCIGAGTVINLEQCLRALEAVRRHDRHAAGDGLRADGRAAAVP